MRAEDKRMVKSERLYEKSTKERRYHEREYEDLENKIVERIQDSIKKHLKI